MVTGYLLQGLTIQPGKVPAGGQVTLRIEVRAPETGGLLASVPEFRWYAGDGSLVAAFAVFDTTIVAGLYSHAYEVPTTKPLGWWRLEVKTNGAEALIDVPMAMEVY